MIAPIRWLTSSYGKSSRIPSLSTPLLLSVTQIDRPAFHPCHRFILRDGPSSRLTEPPLSFPLSLSPTLRIYPSLHSRTYRCFIGIHYLSTAANKSFPGVEGYRCTQVSAPGTRKVEERERMGKKVIRHRNHVLQRGERSNGQIFPRREDFDAWASFNLS